MHPTMADWLAELDLAQNPRTALEEALRFLDVAARGGRGSASSAATHAAWKARQGFDVVMAHALALRNGAPLTAAVAS